MPLLITDRRLLLLDPLSCSRRLSRTLTAPGITAANCIGAVPGLTPLLATCPLPADLLARVNHYVAQIATSVDEVRCDFQGLLLAGSPALRCAQYIYLLLSDHSKWHPVRLKLVQFAQGQGGLPHLVHAAEIFYAHCPRKSALRFFKKKSSLLVGAADRFGRTAATFPDDIRAIVLDQLENREVAATCEADPSIAIEYGCDWKTQDLVQGEVVYNANGYAEDSPTVTTLGILAKLLLVARISKISSNFMVDQADDPLPIVISGSRAENSVPADIDVDSSEMLELLHSLRSSMCWPVAGAKAVAHLDGFCIIAAMEALYKHTDPTKDLLRLDMPAIQSTTQSSKIKTKACPRFTDASPVLLAPGRVNLSLVSGTEPATVGAGVKGQDLVHPRRVAEAADLPSADRSCQAGAPNCQPGGRSLVAGDDRI